MKNISQRWNVKNNIFCAPSVLILLIILLCGFKALTSNNIARCSEKVNCKYGKMCDFVIRYKDQYYCQDMV